MAKDRCVAKTTRGSQIRSGSAKNHLISGCTLNCATFETETTQYWKTYVWRRSVPIENCFSVRPCTAICKSAMPNSWLTGFKPMSSPSYLPDPNNCTPYGETLSKRASPLWEKKFIRVSLSLDSFILVPFLFRLVDTIWYSCINWHYCVKANKWSEQLSGSWASMTLPNV